MNNSTRLLSLFSPHPPPPSSIFLLRGLYISRLTNVRRFHRRAYSPSSVGSTNNGHRSLRQLVSLPPLIPTFPIGRFYTHQARVSAADFVPSYHHHQLPEWTELLQSLSQAGYFSDSGSVSGSENEFFPGFPNELLRPAVACLALARDRPELLEMLSRRDVEVVVNNGKPFLFRSGPDSLRRLSLYLRSGIGIGKILDSDKASTVDLMRLLLSYVVAVASSERSKHHNQDIMESSVRSLLSQLAKMTVRTPELNVHRAIQNQMSDSNGQGSYQKNIEMKRGDWICSRCSGMNFARNVKCFQCDEARPKRQLTGSEWDCPQCDFYNYGRNVACLRCDCKRPRDFSLNSSNSGYSNDPELERRLAENEEKAQRWFNKVAQGGSEANNIDTDEDFPEIMPLRKGVNRYVVSTRKTPLERRLSNAENSVATDGNNNKVLGSKTHRSLNEILGSSSSLASQSDDKNVSSRRFESSQAINSNFVPFVPLPSDMFAKKPEEETQIGLTENNQMDGVSSDSQNVFQEDRSNANLSGKETNNPEEDDKESEEKTARWFKRVTELHNVSDLENTIPEEISSDKMPMRKGENRFVVSRKKDRSLTSPANKRPQDSDFVPFVPFPPDYFAKEKQPEQKTDTIPPPAPAPAPATENISQVVEEEPKQPSSNNPETMAWRSSNRKSLEGSLVKEPDLLDMSEEAKAERWFKRVAEIKNISELSQIPDEDFPSIMPMRKGVNRFVVSKRKTPLERRLASQRQQRNPQINNYDPTGEGDK
ncbi:PREDICTED: zinc finger protein VAR3, chloroplastic [Camelina sativa]|uniref:Zinc finger protein VAR3, chloroplastic n=1 Tax=Camelina sativa TaxID=90675 RepID=A0ABM0T3W1_CAMSA|nr:PREDICTED: zinc finger protein VAR3, chloroplastic [Camelina sativa]